MQHHPFPIAVRLENLGLPFRDALAAAARLGAEGVEFDAVGPLSPRELSDTGRREVRHRIRQCGLKLVAIGFPTRGGYDEPERLEARIAGTGDALKLAYDLGTPTVINHIGRIPPVDAPERLLRDFQEALGRVASEGDRVGARLAVQTGADPPDRLVAFLKELGASGLAINFAPANLLMHGADLTGSTVAMAPWLAGVHVRDVVRSLSAASGVKEAPLGKGEIPWREILAALSTTDYAGSLTVVRDEASTNHKSIAEAVAWLRQSLT